MIKATNTACLWRDLRLRDRYARNRITSEAGEILKECLINVTVFLSERNLVFRRTN